MCAAVYLHILLSCLGVRRSFWQRQLNNRQGLTLATAQIAR